MKLKQIVACILPVFVGALIVSQPLEADANGGGQVGQDAVIEFYTDETEPPASSSELPASSSDSSSDVPVKPPGKLPSTGEVVKRSLALSGAMLLAIVLIFFWLKRRKEKEEIEK